MRRSGRFRACLKAMFRSHVLPTLVWHVYTGWALTWKRSFHEHPAFVEAFGNREPVILAHWHGDELATLPMVRRYRLATMTSLSKDGQLIDGIIRRFGGETSRGSSSRSGVSALRGLVRLCRQGYVASMAVDGPRGPIYQVKPGVFELSRLLGARIFPGGVAASRAIVFRKSWNRAYLPSFFAKVGVCIGEPLAALSRSDDPRDPRLAAALRDGIFRSREQAFRLIGEEPPAIF